MSERSSIELETLGSLEAAYMDLLQIPATAIWRLNNQPIYCEIRDAIARLNRIDPEKIQNDFETAAKRLQLAQRTRGASRPSLHPLEKTL